MLNTDINIVTLEYKPITKRLELIDTYLFRFISFNPYNQAYKYNITQNDHTTNKAHHITYRVTVFIGFEQYN